MHPGNLTYPLRSDYVDALQNPALTLSDPVLRSARVECDHLGMPRPISGAFASVFQVTSTDSRHWAIKCFCQYIPDQERRYHEIATALEQLQHPALVEFKYQQSGIMVAGSRYPILKMQWLEAQGLIPWLENNRFDAGRLRHVADQLITLVNDLESAGIAHGDLQHGNLLVTPRDQLRLIDYDGMYVPALQGLPACEKGLANYQSPARQDQHFQPRLDRFAGWVIYASLIAISEAPFLWGQLRTDGDEKLLFDAHDYADPRNSSALASLHATGNPVLGMLSKTIADIAYSTIDGVPPLARLAGPQIQQVWVAPPTSTNALPSWFDRQRVMTQLSSPIDSPAASGPLPDGSWLQEHLAPLPTRTFRGAISVMRRVVTLLSLVTSLLLIGIIGLTLTYRRHPLSRDARQARRHLSVVQKGHRSAHGEYALIIKKRSHLDAEHAKQQDSIRRARASTGVDLQRQMTAIGNRISSALAGEAREIATINASEAARRAERLERVRQAYVAQRLTQTRIAASPPHGIGQQLLDRLAQHGIRSAADFTNYSVSGSSKTRNEFAQIHLQSGQRVHIDGIGRAKARSLVDWRNQTISAAARSQPTRLSPTDEQQIQNEMTAARIRAKQTCMDAKSMAQQDQRIANQKHGTAQSGLDQQEAADNNAYAVSRNLLDQNAALTQRGLAEQQATLNQAQQIATSYRKITFGQYIRISAFGS